MQKASHINYPDLNILPPLITKYVNKEEGIKSYISDFWNEAAFEKQIALKQEHPVDRAVLVKELLSQYREYKLDNAEPSLQNIALLGNEKTFTITTGHQLNLFTGPLYFIYKIITAINLAEFLKNKHPEFNFVPVYWMASEDHDFEEINHINIQGKKIEWENNSGGRAGTLDTKGLAEAIEELKSSISNFPFGNELIEILNEAYLSSGTYAAATAKLVHRLFRKYGLVIINADNAALKKNFVDIAIDDALNNNAYKSVTTTSEELVSKNLTAKVQVNPREVNLFYVEGNIRQRIQKENNRLFTEGGKSWSPEEFRSFAQQHPEHLSPNVVLRPVYQEFTLPNLAYIGGAGELSYWLQLKSTFDHYKVPYPLLGLRHSALLMDKQTQERMNKFSFSLADLFLNEDALVNKYISSKHETEGEYFSDEKAVLAETYAKMKETISTIDPTLASSVEAELQKALNGLQAIEGKIKKALKQKNEVDVNQIRKLKQKLFPENTLQERYENLSYYYAKEGTAFIDDLKSQMTSFTPAFMIFGE